ncbi:riboflavin synthase [soil metagenome]
MFTGIIEEIGTLRSIEPLGKSIRIEVATTFAGIQRGDSISVDGVCLTAEEIVSGGFTLFASPETMDKSSLGGRRVGDGVNLERALTLQTRLGGHLVSGHVDATGTFASARFDNGAHEIRIAAPPEILRQCIAKGSVAIDGISLTIVDLTEKEISAWIIPETWKKTTLSNRKPGDRVNLETDLIGKYVFRFLQTQGSDVEKKDGALKDLLEKGGWIQPD